MKLEIIIKMEDSLQEKNKVSKNTTDKIIDSIIGDREKWKQVPSAMKQLGKDLLNKETRPKLIFIGSVWFFGTLGFMYLIWQFQMTAQFCEIGNSFMDVSLIEIPYDAPNYANVLEMDIPEDSIIKCEWDIPKWWNNVRKNY